MRGLKYVSLKNGGAAMILPMIVVETDSCLEMRDCLVRSSRNENGGPNDDASDDRSEWTLKDRSGSFLGPKRDS